MEELKKNQNHTVTITGYTSEGLGVCRIGTRAVFVKGALAGEVWSVVVTKVTSSAAYARGLELISASPERIEPACENFGVCGGCDLMHMTYDEELRFKLTRVNDAFRRIGGLDFAVESITGADTYESYRNKAIYAVGTDKNGLPSVGFFRPRTHEIIPVTRCHIQHPESDAAALSVLGWMRSEGVAAYDEGTGKGLVRHVFTRRAWNTDDFMVCVVCTGNLGSKAESLICALKAACQSLTGILLCRNTRPDNTVLSGSFKTLWGRGTVTDTLCGLSFRLSPDSFYQINPPQAQLLYDKAVEFASPDGDATVLDLYCGAGTITLCMAKRAKRAIGVEIVPAAVENARENACKNEVLNAEFICGDAGQAAKELLERGLSPDCVVVDPPRKGLSGDVITAVASMSPKRVVYVSCDPGTLARDLKIFSGLDYAPMTGQAFDLFPRCAHVECVVLLARKD